MKYLSDAHVVHIYKAMCLHQNARKQRSFFLIKNFHHLVERIFVRKIIKINFIFCDFTEKIVFKKGGVKICFL